MSCFFWYSCGFYSHEAFSPAHYKLKGQRCSFTIVGSTGLMLLFSRLSKKVWRKAKKVIANSDGLKNLALATAPQQEINVIWNGVNLEEFTPAKTNSTKEGEKLQLITVGRLIERKGFEFLIKALQGIDNIELSLIGEGYLKEELELLATRLGVRVHFLGKVNHESIPGYLRQADVFVLPSLNEGMSNAIIEAMACGLPVIATDTGGSKERSGITASSSIEAILWI